MLANNCYQQMGFKPWNLKIKKDFDVQVNMAEIFWLKHT